MHRIRAAGPAAVQPFTRAWRGPRALGRTHTLLGVRRPNQAACSQRARSATSVVHTPSRLLLIRGLNTSLSGQEQRPAASWKPFHRAQVFEIVTGAISHKALEEREEGQGCCKPAQLMPECPLLLVPRKRWAAVQNLVQHSMWGSLGSSAMLTHTCSSLPCSWRCSPARAHAGSHSVPASRESSDRQVCSPQALLRHALAFCVRAFKCLCCTVQTDSNADALNTSLSAGQAAVPQGAGGSGGGRADRACAACRGLHPAGWPGLGLLHGR